MIGRTGNHLRPDTNITQLRLETSSQIRRVLPKLQTVGKDDTGIPWKELAEIFGRLRSINAALWRLEEALSMGCVQVQICLGLANAQSETTSAELAASFVGLTECVRDLRLSEEACAVATHAAQHYDRRHSLRLHPCHFMLYLSDSSPNVAETSVIITAHTMRLSKPSRYNKVVTHLRPVTSTYWFLATMPPCVF